MSERVALAGNKAPPHTITHDGKTYTIRPVLTEGVMMGVEARLYAKAKEALKSQRDMMDDAMYERKLDQLRARYEADEFAFESKQTLEYLKTRQGGIMLLLAIMDCTEAELLEMMAQKNLELEGALKDVLSATFPAGTQVPKLQARQRVKKKR